MVGQKEGRRLVFRRLWPTAIRIMPNAWLDAPAAPSAGCSASAGGKQTHGLYSDNQTTDNNQGCHAPFQKSKSYILIFIQNLQHKSPKTTDKNYVGLQAQKRKKQYNARSLCLSGKRRPARNM